MTHTLPQTALAYPTCKALKEAGFPQGQTVMVWIPYHGDGDPPDYFRCTRFEAINKHGHQDTALFACPNSDELLAAIRERWPKCWDTDVFELGLMHNELGEVIWYIEILGRDGRPETAAYGFTLAVALAALYIALAGVTP